MKKPKNLGCIIGGIFFAILLAGILLPTVGTGLESGPRPVTKNDETQLVLAIRAFYTEYGRLPKTSAECVPADGKLMAILIGTNHQENPSKIEFIEVPNARKKNGIWKQGLRPESGTWLDPYGNPYLVKLDTDYDGFIPNPYSDPAAGQKKIAALVIVWSPGKDGIFGNPKAPGQFQGSDDIISWQ